MKGFSLIELLVAITVILVIVSLSFASYSRLTIKQNLVSAGLLIKNVIRDTQSRAFNGETDCNNCDCSPNSGSSSEGWILDFTTNSIYGLCGAGIKFLETPFTLPKGITLGYSSATIQFNASTYAITTTPPDITAIICLYNSNYVDNYYRITLNSSGVIEDKLDTTCPYL